MTCKCEDKDYPDPPSRDEKPLRALVSQRFPNYGYDNEPEYVSIQIGASPCIIGDAIDDILEIAGDLYEVEWRWAHTSEDDALRAFQDSYETHWSAHLQGLQFYLHHFGHEKNTKTDLI